MHAASTVPDSHHKSVVCIPGARAVPAGGAGSQRGSLRGQSGLHRYDGAARHPVIVHSEQTLPHNGRNKSLSTHIPLVFLKSAEGFGTLSFSTFCIHSEDVESSVADGTSNRISPQIKG